MLFFIIFIQSQPAMIQEPVTVSGKEAATFAESRAWKSGGDNEFYEFSEFYEFNEFLTISSG